MTTLMAFILGIVEGMTEFLPVSSTGHLILASNALGIENNDFLKLFEIVIQTGAILAIIFIYFKELWADKTYVIKLAVAFFPTGVLGLVAYPIIKKYLFTPEVVVGALFIGGIVLIFLEQFTARIPERKQTYPRLFLLGIFQCLAFIPGVSRSASTILGAKLLGASRAEAVKFSFLLAIPTILSASGYSLLKVNHALTMDEIWYLVVGLVTSFVFGYISVKIFLKLLDKKAFVICGVYRIIFALIYFFVFIR